MTRLERIDLLVGDHAARLSERLQAHRRQLFLPDARRHLRKFTSGAVAELLGVKDAHLRKLHLTDTAQNPRSVLAGGATRAPKTSRRCASCWKKAPRHLAPACRAGGRRPSSGDHRHQFQGRIRQDDDRGASAQRLALDGYRVLAIDLDPQASFSALHGFQPEFDLTDGGTL